MREFLVSLAKNGLPEAYYYRLLHFYTSFRTPRKDLSSTEYWSRHHVTFSDEPDFFQYRRHRYFNYAELLPTSGHSGKTILDFGCGPGIEAVSLLMESKNIRLICADTSGPSLRIAEKNLRTRGFDAKFVQIPPDGFDTGLEDNSIDMIHCVGVLHHTAEPEACIREFRRILKPGGYAQVMVYHRNSLYFHLYVTYIIQIRRRLFLNNTIDDAFRMSTDGPNCPISRAWSIADVKQLCIGCEDLKVSYLGTGYEPEDLLFRDRIAEAVYSEKITEHTRGFLKSVEFDARLLPYTVNERKEKIGAGLQLCMRIDKES